MSDTEFPASYKWGSGMFRDIAGIRRGVYTEYYVMVEHADTLREILGKTPESHCRRLLQKIESPEFDIDSKNYEQIKAYLWREALSEFAPEIQKWLGSKSAAFQTAGQALLRSVSSRIKFPLNEHGEWRKAMLLGASMALFDVMTAPDYEKVVPQVLDAAEWEGEAEGLIVGIDFFEKFYQIVRKPQKIVLLPGDIAALALDLKLYGECLLANWMKELTGEARPFQITLLVNENYCPRNNNKSIQRNATRADVEAAIKFEDLDQLRGYVEAGFFKVRSFRSDFSGTVLSELDAESLSVLHEADYVIALGEQNNITLTELPVHSFRIFAIRDFSSIFYTGIKNNTEEHKYPKLALLDVPAGIRPAIDYFPDLKTVVDARRYYEIYQSVSMRAWDRLIESARADFEGNVLDAVRRTDILNDEEKRKSPHLPHAENAVDFMAQRHLAEFGGVYHSEVNPVNERRARVLHVLHYPQGAENANGERLKLGIAFAGQVKNFRGAPKSLLTYDDVARHAPEAIFGFNMLYFITRNIILKFNQSSPHFNLHESFFGEYIDFLKYPGKDKDLFYPSLYNKGAFGLKKDGTFEFGRIRLPDSGTVAIPIDGERIPFTWTSVNPLTDFSEQVSIFTPLEARFMNPNLRAPHYVGGTRALIMLPENDNFNFVFINNILLGVARGVTEIPPFGTVLSVPPALLSGNVRKAVEKNLVTAKEKRLATRETHVVFDFQLEEKWRDCEWIMGGALLMVDEGKVESMDFDKDNSPNSLYRIEGWDLESSQRTQETPVETNLNEARMTIGLTTNNEFFISVIEGRANNRTGATHVETVEWIQEYFNGRGARVHYALDLDSASSVSLGVFRGGELRLLNQTARGSDSKLYDTRYYNHLGYLYKTSE